MPSSVETHAVQEQETCDHMEREGVRSPMS